VDDSFLAARVHTPGTGLPAGERSGLRLILLCSLAGVFVAIYLLKLHVAIAGNPRRGLCTFNDTLTCDKVLASPYAEIAGVPVALIGLLGFLLLFGLAAWRLWRRDRSSSHFPAILVLVAGIGLLFELGMTWVEFFVIQALCPYCLTALGLIAASFVAAVVAWRAPRESAGMEAGRG
jgi:uncharacterized membrane protein